MMTCPMCPSREFLTTYYREEIKVMFTEIMFTGNLDRAASVFSGRWAISRPESALGPTVDSLGSPGVEGRGWWGLGAGLLWSPGLLFHAHISYMHLL